MAEGPRNVGDHGWWIVDTEDRIKFSAIIQVTDRRAAIGGSILDANASITKLEARIKVLKELKKDLDDQRNQIEFEVFPKYGMSPGQNFETDKWELKGVGPPQVAKETEKDEPPSESEG